MKVGFIQFKPIFGEKEKNVSRTIEFIKKVKDADLLVLPELCNTGYLFENLKELELLGENVTDGLSIKAWEKIARDMNLYLAAGFCEKATKKIFYNSAVLIGPNGVIDVYRKIHLFNTEKDFFKRGNTPLKIYNIGKAKIGIMVCFDWIFPEISRILALKGAEIICHPANLVLPYAQKVMLTRSIENKVFTITANRIGEDVRTNAKISFTGLSQITSPQMELLIQGTMDQEEIKVIDIEPSLAKNKMITAKNHVFLDRRIDLYQPLLEKYVE